MDSRIEDPRALVFFAVKEEARFFKPAGPLADRVRVVITGIGRTNAGRAAAAALAESKPALVLTCGFAGGLNPALPAGEVVLEMDPGFPLALQLSEAGARAATFHCADQVAVTAAAKAELRRTVGADAVEMESGVIRQLCRARGLPSATVRVISDAADEDLPLDFNALLTPDFRLPTARLALALVRSPSLVSKLIRFHRQTSRAARRLGDLLARVLASG